jgi:hypothetical protein
MRTMRNACEIVARKSLGKRLPGRSRGRTGKETSGSTKRGFLSLLKKYAL